MDEKKVNEVMLLLEEYATVSWDATIAEALQALSKAQMGLTYDRHHHRAIVVLGDSGEVVGKLSHWAILRSLEPRFLDKADMESLARVSLSPDFISYLEQGAGFFKGSLAALCSRAGRIKVKDAMVPIGESVEDGAPLTDAIHLFVRTHAQSIIVTRRGRPIGVLRLSDVFEEVADLIRSSCVE